MVISGVDELMSGGFSTPAEIDLKCKKSRSVCCGTDFESRIKIVAKSAYFQSGPIEFSDVIWRNANLSNP